MSPPLIARTSSASLRGSRWAEGFMRDVTALLGADLKGEPRDLQSPSQPPGESSAWVPRVSKVRSALDFPPRGARILRPSQEGNPPKTRELEQTECTRLSRMAAGRSA